MIAYLTVREAALALAVHPTMIYVYVRNGALPAFAGVLDGVWHIPRAALVEFVDRRAASDRAALAEAPALQLEPAALIPVPLSGGRIDTYATR